MIEKRVRMRGDEPSSSGANDTLSWIILSFVFITAFGFIGYGIYLSKFKITEYTYQLVDVSTVGDSFHITTVGNGHYSYSSSIDPKVKFDVRLRNDGVSGTDLCFTYKGYKLISQSILVPLAEDVGVWQARLEELNKKIANYKEQKEREQKAAEARMSEFKEKNRDDMQEMRDKEREELKKYETPQRVLPNSK